METRNAATLAGWAGASEHGNTRAFMAFKEVAMLAGLPPAPVALGPAQMASAILNSPYGAEYAGAAAVVATLRSK